MLVSKNEVDNRFSNHAPEGRRLRDILTLLQSRPQKRENPDWLSIELADLRRATYLIREAVGNRVAEAINEYIALRSQNSLRQKEAIVQWCREQLDSFDLSIQCPKSSRTLELWCKPDFDGDDRGTFVLTPTGDNNLKSERKYRTLPALHFVPRTKLLNGRGI
jgi:hypothetical protein